MADSDSEVSFESADEGDLDSSEQKAVSEKGHSHKEAKTSEPSTKAANTQNLSDAGSDDRTEESRESSVTLKSSDVTSANNREDVETSKTSSADENKDGEDVKAEQSREPTKDGAKAEDSRSESGAGDGKEAKEEEPRGEEIRDRGSTETVESDAKLGGAPQHAVAAGASEGSWGWGGWGSSLLSSAAATVTKVSDNVGKGLTSVLENVESSLGVPKPEELSEVEKKEVEEEQQKRSSQSDDQETPSQSDDTAPGEPESASKPTGDGQEAEQAGGPGIGSFFSLGASAFTNVMEKTVSGGLDALEVLGRKTMEVLQEGDPRLEKKRALLVPTKEKTNLSEVLKQAKEEAEAEAARRQEEEEHQKYNFGILFDQYQGLAHLEALEMLSNQSETKVQASIAMVTDEDLEGVKTDLLEVRDAFQLENMDSVEEDATNDQDFVNVVTELLFSLSMAATPDKLQRAQKEAKEWLTKHSSGQSESTEEGEDKLEIKDVHAKAMQTLAELTARTIEQFHKVAELMLLYQDKGPAKSPVERATTLSKLASILSAELSAISTRFCELLSSMAGQTDEANAIITNIYLEASNSASYIQDAFQLLLPVMQELTVKGRSTDAT